MKVTHKYCIITTTSNQEDTLRKITMRLIEENLSNCAQIEQIKSIYKWHDKIEITDEYRLQIKALYINYVMIEAIIKDNHNYELPEIIMIDISGGHDKYLEWLEPQPITIAGSVAGITKQTGKSNKTTHIPYKWQEIITTRLITEAQIIDQEIDLRFHFSGKYCYVDVCRYGIDSQLFRLTYTGNMEHWEYATAKHNSVNNSVVYVYAGNPRDHYTLEESIQLCEDIHWHML